MITLPAPIIESSPILTPSLITEFAPIKTLSPTSTLPHKTAPGEILVALPSAYSCSIIEPVFNITKSPILELDLHLYLTK